MTSPFALDDRIVLITGSTRGIGRALAQACVEAGAHVVINGRSAEAVQAVVTELSDAGHSVSGRAADVTAPAAVEEMVSSIEAEIGPVQGLINNAGIQRRAPFVDFPLDDLKDVVEMNLVAPFIVSQAVARRMVARQYGRIVNIGSVQSQLGRPTIVPYAATKGGVVLLTRGMCAELGPSNVQVNGIAPGYFATELTQALVDDAEFSAWVADRTPAGRWGDVSELGGAAVFLLSDAASFVNGQTLYVDGGMTAVV